MRSNLGGEPPYDWGDFDDLDEMSEKSGQFFISGVAFFMVTVVVYSAILYYVISVLENAEIISGRIPWTPLCLSVFLVNLLRVWDRALFRRK
jgi:hypothetical protein